jgi:hypothetical protein
VYEQGNYIRSKLLAALGKQKTQGNAGKRTGSGTLNASAVEKVDDSMLSTETYLSNLTKSNIIFQKYVYGLLNGLLSDSCILSDVNRMKYKIIMMELPELKCIEIFVYNKPNNFLQKIFVLQSDFITFAERFNAAALESDKSLERLLLKYDTKLC